MTNLSSFTALYVQTAKENVQAIKSGLEKGEIEVAYRNAHTLKSKSYLMGEKEIGDLAKTIEDTLYNIKNKTSSLSQEVLANLIDKVKQIEEKI